MTKVPANIPIDTHVHCAVMEANGDTLSVPYKPQSSDGASSRASSQASGTDSRSAADLSSQSSHASTATVVRPQSGGVDLHDVTLSRYEDHMYSDGEQRSGDGALAVGSHQSMGLDYASHLGAMTADPSLEQPVAVQVPLVGHLDGQARDGREQASNHDVLNSSWDASLIDEIENRQSLDDVDINSLVSESESPHGSLAADVLMRRDSPSSGAGVRGTDVGESSLLSQSHKDPISKSGSNASASQGSQAAGCGVVDGDVGANMEALVRSICMCGSAERETALRRLLATTQVFSSRVCVCVCARHVYRLLGKESFLSLFGTSKFTTECGIRDQQLG
jgi:hypothetical protein